MTTKAELNGADLAAVNAALSFSMQQIIEAQQFAVPLDKRKIDFTALDRALAAAERLVVAHGPDTALPGQFGATPRGLLEQVRAVAAAAAPYRPKEKERRA